MKVVLEFTGEVNSDFEYTLDINELEMQVDDLDFKPLQELASRGKLDLVRTQLRSPGGPTGRRNTVAEVAAATEFRQVLNERNNWESKCCTVEAEVEELKGELASLRLQLKEQHRHQPGRPYEMRDDRKIQLVLEANLQKEQMAQEVDKLRHQLEMQAGQQELQNKLYEENRRLRESLKQARNEASFILHHQKEMLAAAELQAQAARVEADAERTLAAEARTEAWMVERKLAAAEERQGRSRTQQKTLLLEISRAWTQAQGEEEHAQRAVRGLQQHLDE